MKEFVKDQMQQEIQSKWLQMKQDLVNYKDQIQRMSKQNKVLM